MVVTPRSFCVLFVSFISACTDAATRVAYDIEGGSKELGPANGSRATIRHQPKPTPEGCAGSYGLSIDKGTFSGPDKGWIEVVCAGGKSGYNTTYHLNFVDVPARFEIQKNAGETSIIELERIRGRAVVVALH